LASKAEKKTVWVLRAQVISMMRRLFRRSPMCAFVLKAAQVPFTAKKKDGSESKARRVLYKCACCGKTYPYKEVAVDHVLPVINPDHGFVDFNELISRMFVEVEIWDKDSTHDLSKYLQVLCKECHNNKTQEENKTRRKKKKGSA
jgi:5-methylcytosine-specific restriction endonuclease McrA